MNVTDKQLLDLREAVQRNDTARTKQILDAIREENPSASRAFSDIELQKRLLLRASRLYT